MNWLFAVITACVIFCGASCQQDLNETLIEFSDQSNTSVRNTYPSTLSTDSTAVQNGSKVQTVSLINENDLESSIQVPTIVFIHVHQSPRSTEMENGTEKEENATSLLGDFGDPSSWNNENLTESLNMTRNFTIVAVKMLMEYTNWTEFDSADNKTCCNSSSLAASSIVAFLNSDALFNALTISLISGGVLAIVSLVILVIWKRRCSGMSGEWVINDTIYGKNQPLVAAFDNDCFSMDSKVGSYAPMLETNGVKKCKPPTSAGTSKNGMSSRNNDCGKVENEVMEMIEKSFSSDSHNLP